MVAIKKPFIYTAKRFWAGILLAQFLFFYFCSKINFIIGLFGRFFEFQKKIHQQLFSNFSFSMGDILYICFGIFLLYLLIKNFKKTTRKSALLNLLISANIFYFIYQLFWGMLYFQLPLITYLPKEEISLNETELLALKYLNLCKESRSVLKEDENGVFVLNDLSEVEREILQNQKNLPNFITQNKVTEINSFKPSLFQGVMSYTGILGYYNPFTAEAQYNAELPSVSLPFTLAHESMHQFGFAREQEANFTGYLVGRNTQNRALRYSTEYFVLKSLLNSMVEKNPEFVKKVLQNYSVGMKRDRIAEKIFRKKHEGFLDVIFGFTNDLFLKSNQQDGSVTYSYFIDLLIRYERNAS